MKTLYLKGYKQHLPTEQLIWLQAEGNYTRVYGQAGQSWLLSQTLKWYDQQLPAFIRVNKSALVNPLYVELFQQLSSKHGRVVLKDGQELRVARRRIEPAKAQFQQ